MASRPKVPASEVAKAAVIPKLMSVIIEPGKEGAVYPNQRWASADQKTLARGRRGDALNFVLMSSVDVLLMHYVIHAALPRFARLSGNEFRSGLRDLTPHNLIPRGQFRPEK